MDGAGSVSWTTEYEPLCNISRRLETLNKHHVTINQDVYPSVMYDIYGWQP